jgi:hypothetical protein
MHRSFERLYLELQGSINVPSPDLTDATTAESSTVNTPSVEVIDLTETPQTGSKMSRSASENPAKRKSAGEASDRASKQRRIIIDLK